MESSLHYIAAQDNRQIGADEHFSIVDNLLITPSLHSAVSYRLWQRHLPKSAPALAAVRPIRSKLKLAAHNLFVEKKLHPPAKLCAKTVPAGPTLAQKYTPIHRIGRLFSKKLPP